MVDGPDDAGAVDKAELRARLRTIRRTITADPADRAARSARLWSAAAERIGWNTPGGASPLRIMMFESRSTEPDTSKWFEAAQARGADVYLPAVDGVALRVEPGDLDPARLDVVLVPGLGFTADGRRLGQGGGHYDRFLPRLDDRCLTMGVCFAEQILDDLPTEAHDRRVDIVVTD